MKQDAWVTQVRAAIKRVQEPRLNKLLRSIQSHENIPRKEEKFVRFLQNSLRVKNRNLCLEAWQAIKQEAGRLGELEAPPHEIGGESGEAAENEEAEEKMEQQQNKWV